MRVELRDKKKNPDYNNIIHFPEHKWKWVIHGTTNRCIDPTGISLYLWGWTSQTMTFCRVIQDIENNKDICGFCSVEVQPTGGMIHYHSVWTELSEIDTIKQWFKENTGTGKKFTNSLIEPYQPRHITEKDWLWYMVKKPLDVYYNRKLVGEIEYYKDKVNFLEKRLKRKPGYFVPSRFNHLKHFLSKESRDIDFENGMNHLLKGGDNNGK